MPGQQQYYENNSPLLWIILTALADGPKDVAWLHDIIEQQTDLSCEPGTLFRCIASLVQRNWIEREDHLYHITPAGMSALETNQAGTQQVSPAKTFMMRIILWILGLYPRAWRERYEPEMLALLDAHTVTFLTVLDLLYGVIDARLDPHYQRTNPLMLQQRVRTTSLLTMGAAGFFLFSVTCWLSVSDINSPTDLDKLVSSLSPFTTVILAPLSELTVFFLLAFIVMNPCLIIAKIVRRIARDGQVGKHLWHLLRLLPVAISLGLMLTFPWFSTWIHNKSWMYGTVAFILLMNAVGETAAFILISRKGWIEREWNSFLLAAATVAPMVLVCIMDIIWTITAWPLIPIVAVVRPTWQFDLVIQLLLMCLSTALAILALIRSFKASRKLSEMNSVPQQDPPLQMQTYR